MNAAEYDAEIGKLNTRAIEEGIAKGKLSVGAVVASLETQKFIVLQLDYEGRQANMAAKLAAAALKPGEAASAPPPAASKPS